MSSPDQDAFKSAIIDLREMLSSSQADPSEALKLITQLESGMKALEAKAVAVPGVVPVSPVSV